MRVTIVLGPQWKLPPAGFGAVEKVWMALADTFAQQGHEVCVIGRGGAGRGERTLTSGVRVMERKGFSSTGVLWLDLCKDLLYALQILPAIPRSDIVVTNCFSLPVVLAPVKRLKGKVVVHVARFPKGQMGLYRGADSVQAISGAVAHAIVRQCGALKDRVAVVGYPVDTDLYSVPAEGRRMSGEPEVLYVGRVHPEKGVHLLVEAFRNVCQRVPKARLRIVGPTTESQGGGGSDYVIALKAAAAGLSVEFAPPISDPRELSRAYQRADCFCYPSLAEKGEAFGLAVLEAMATGLPCVVSNLECFADFLSDGIEGVSFDHRGGAPAAALADAICSVLSDPNGADALGRNARRKAEQFSLGRIAEAYLGLFARVAFPPAGTTR